MQQIPEYCIMSIVATEQAKTMAVKKRASRGKTVAHDEKRLKIVAQCANLFDQVGYHRATMQMLADEVGLGKPSLYHYFASKTDILYEMHQMHIAALIDGLNAEVGKVSDPGELLKRACTDILREIAEHPGYVRAFMDHYAELEGKKRIEIRNRRQEYFKRICDIITKGIADKTFRPCDPEVTAYAFLGMCSWAYKWYPPMATTRAPEEVADAIATVFIDGLRASKKASPTATRSTEKK